MERNEEAKCKSRRPRESEHVGLMEAIILNHDKQKQRWTSVGPEQRPRASHALCRRGKPSRDTATVCRKTRKT